MEDLVPTIQDFIVTHRAWAGPILGMISFGESLILIGLFFPATALLFVTGGLIQKGILDPVTVVAWSVAGAVLGDIVTYWLGRWIGLGITRRYPFNRDKSAIARARLFFRKYGFLSIFLGRFLGPVRSTIPLIAGVMRMKHLTFQIANVTSAFVWVPIMLAPGYYGAKLIGDFSTIGWKTWLFIGIAVVALTAGLTYLGIRMGARERKKDRHKDHTLAASTTHQNEADPANAGS